jgi:DNA helicase INO80
MSCFKPVKPAAQYLFFKIVITDFKYLNRVNWQYLVLDEAQAIKSASSQRWKLLLEFKCRGRLLLSGAYAQYK